MIITTRWGGPAQQFRRNGINLERRCKGSTSSGQCTRAAKPGGEFCAVHNTVCVVVIGCRSDKKEGCTQYRSHMDPACHPDSTCAHCPWSMLLSETK